jgi:UDP-N-acetylglucosamine 2-epimerase
MRDLLERIRPSLDARILGELQLAPGRYALLTLHRAHNTGDRDRLAGILAAVADAGEPVIFPVHPRTRRALDEMGLAPGGSLRPIDPLGYRDMLALQQHARVVLTDSGGVQKEAYWLGVPCITLREETEWTETVDAGWNRLAGSDASLIRAALLSRTGRPARPQLYGDGHAADRIAALVAAR